MPLPTPYYAYPDSGNQSLVDLIQYSNSVTSDIFGIMIIVSTFAVVFIGVQTPDVRIRFTISSIITAISSILLSAMGIVYGLAVLIPMIIAVLSIGIMLKD